MKAALEAFLASIQKLSREELIQRLISMKKDELGQTAILAEMRNTATAMSREFIKLRAEYEDTKEELTRLKKDFAAVCEKNAQLLRKVFGRQSEKMEYMEDELPREDPLAEDAEEGSEETQPELSSADKEQAASGPKAGRTGNKPRKQRQGMDLDRLPADHVFEIDTDELDARFGEGNWTVYSWHVKRKVERIPEMDYVRYTHVPVIAAGPEKTLYGIPFGPELRDYSVVTASLAASVMFKKFALGIPLYRQEWDLLMRGFPLSRQNMANWIVYFALNLFGPVYDRLWQELKRCPYIQNDETTLQVIHDGRKAGRLSYMWVHMTSELWEGNPVILFAYEMTRKADHLREYFGDYTGTMTSDAFSAYYTFAGEHEETVTLSGCLMHARRPIALSAAVKGAERMTEEEKQALPEYGLLNILAQIFELEKNLRDLTADERKQRRSTEVRPLLDEYFRIIHSLDPDDPGYSRKMKDGIRYAVNQEKELRRFLDDGHIPCDNGACERHIRPFATSRKAWLFCNTIDGAKATAILYTLVETAKASHADVYYYLKYLLDSMPAHMEDHDFCFLDDMMPWSEAYKVYEKEEKAKLINKYRLNGSADPPLPTRCRSGPQIRASA